MRVPPPTAVALICALALSVVGGSAHAAEITVCSSGCDHTSIQDAVDAATSGDTILPGAETFFENVRIEKDLIIRGSGPVQTIVDGSGSWGSVFEIWGDLPRVTLAGMTIQNGRAPHVGGGVGHHIGRLEIDDCIIRDNRAHHSVGLSRAGGGVGSVGNIRISNSQIVQNFADEGGGVFVFCWLFGGPVEIVNTTISENRADMGGGVMVGDRCSDTLIRDSVVSTNTALYRGGGLFLGGSVTISNSTIANNEGGGLHSSRGAELQWCEITRAEITIANSTFAGNYPDGLFVEGYRFSSSLRNSIVAGNDGVQCAGSVEAVMSNGYNLSSDSSCGFTMRTDMENTDPLLLPLADNGGPTPTCALRSDSPAIDAGGRACGPTDQRGVSRPYDGDGHGGARCDIGAFEYAPVLLDVIPQVYDMVLELAGADHDLVAPLHQAIQIREDGDPSNDAEAVTSLQAFIAEVEQQRGLTLTDAEAGELIAEAQRIIALLNFGGAAGDGR